jgi:hypothetical protein
MSPESSDLGGPADGQPRLQRNGGSIKHARERVDAGLPQEEATQNSPRPITPTTPKKPVSPSVIGQAISRPPPALPSPQWPLSSEDDSARRRNNRPTEERTYGKGLPPQRPPRPEYAPSMLGTSRLQEHTPVYQYRQPLSPPQQADYWEQNYELSPGLGSGTATLGTATSSRPSISSSTATIPDFPVPLQVPRRGANLGPPPLSRRGASSYYSQSSYVTPIPEEAAESTKTGHGSFASSHVMPTNWPDGHSGSFLTADDEDDDGVDGDDGRSSRGTDHDESATLVRSASLGKRHKASLTTIRNSDTAEREGINRTSNSTNLPKSKLVSRAATAATASDEASMPGTAASRDAESCFGDNSVSARTAFVIPPIPSDNYESDTPGSGSHTPKYSPGGTPIDPMVRQILGGLEKGGAIVPGTSPPITSPVVSSESPKALKRPEQLDIDAVKEAESRGSLTSLPELIRRATRVATNLDKGRTASRLGLFDMLSAGDSKAGKGDRTRKFLTASH